MRNSWIIAVFLAAKTLQWLNSLALAHIVGKQESFAIMASMFGFMGVLLIFGFLIKTFLPKIAPIAWIFIVFALILISQINPGWVVIVIGGAFLYALIGAEARVMQSIANHKRLPKFVPLLLTLLPVATSYLIPQADNLTVNAFYIITSLLALVASYSARMYGGRRIIVSPKAPPIWLGLLLLAGSGILYYLALYGIDDSPAVPLLAFTIILYACGALVVYASIDERLERASRWA